MISFTGMSVNNDTTSKLALINLTLQDLLISDEKENESLIVYTLREIQASKSC